MNKTFEIEPGDILAEKYRVVEYLGGGWEGEVFRIKELVTGIERAAKIFYPKRNIRNTAAIRYAKKLHKLRSCPFLIQYYSIEKIKYKEIFVSVFISEYVEGILFTQYLKQFKGNILPAYQGLHLLYALVIGIENIHLQGEYHGDLHPENIIIERMGLKFELKLLDLFNLGKASKCNLQTDIIDIIKIFYEAIGGQKHYSKHPKFIKSICCGLKRTLILAKFRTASELKFYLEANDWS